LNCEAERPRFPRRMREDRMRLTLAIALGLAGGMAQADGLTLKIDFDDRAMLTLAQIGERVVVSAFYYGEPSAKGAAHADEMGQIWLGNEDVTIDPLDQKVKLKAALDAEGSGWIKGVPRVNINIFSARLADQNNLLNCDIFEDDIAVAQARVQVLECVLLD
jgi:hypothetical protein